MAAFVTVEQTIMPAPIGVIDKSATSGAGQNVLWFYIFQQIHSLCTDKLFFFPLLCISVFTKHFLIGFIS